MEKEVVILTRSSKNGGFCVAGVDLRTGEWVRFVSEDEQSHGALSRLDITYENQQICKPLDIVSVDVIRPEPSLHQPENYLINSRKYWIKRGEYSLSDVLNVHPAEVRQYIYENTNAFVDEYEIDNIDYSLILAYVSSLTIIQTTNIYNQPRTKAQFFYNGKWYDNISVTDPYYYTVQNGTSFDKAYLVISLPDSPCPGTCYYKFIAKVFSE